MAPNVAQMCFLGSRGSSLGGPEVMVPPADLTGILTVLQEDFWEVDIELSGIAAPAVIELGRAFERNLQVLDERTQLDAISKTAKLFNAQWHRRSLRRLPTLLWHYKYMTLHHKR